MTRLAVRRLLMPWSVVGLGLLAACVLALLVPVQQPKCAGWTGYLPIAKSGGAVVAAVELNGNTYYYSVPYYVGCLASSSGR
jgi:hypothetical protein